MLKQLKIIQVLIIIIALSQIVLTQTREMVIHKNDGVNRTSVADVDSITFQETGTVTDVDDNVYKTVKIGNQWWMAENLKVTKYRNEETISDCWAYGYNENNVSTYGRLYPWNAVNDSRNIAPEGWHVPTDKDWKELEMALGMSESEANNDGYRGTNEGSKLAGRADLWDNGALDGDPKFGASGFAGLPAGYRNMNGGYRSIRGDATFWSATESGDNRAWTRSLRYDYTTCYRTNSRKESGCSIRCVKNP